ncbi:alpha/beta hydrolase [Sphingomonas nostoxanthinifaciens]|uniref:alpha/beta hydrolase n=1 Tax=Sphingomonas nostoxanthinifaciens TaxID=2872652 RepID=UPI001CC20BEB|nr:alpha/beta hydrolase [Sphingomonas nostoxanthinifaciens]UAK23057.1 alpha/beta hydrolase [Sphingomonas nostoxanthinifaciens]
MPSITRRAILGAAAAAAASPRAVAQIAPSDETIDLWPGNPPGAGGTPIQRKVTERSNDPAHPDRWITGVARPTLVVKRAPRPDGSAVLLIPGGGYGFLAYDNEGLEQAAWLNARGTTAFILVYRLPAEGWQRREDVPLQDAQRAMRLIRAGASRYGIAGDRVAVLGFSAGGHLAGSLATRHAEHVYASVDAADQQSARPDIAALIYPVVSMDQPFTHGGSRDNLLGKGAAVETMRARSVERRVDANTPPLFLVQAADDDVVPVANSIALFEAAQTARRPAALHIFEEGGHGFGTRLKPEMPGSEWPRLMEHFAIRHRIFGPRA